MHVHMGIFSLHGLRFILEACEHTLITLLCTRLYARFSALCMATLSLRYLEIETVKTFILEASKHTSCTRLDACFSGLCLGLATLRYLTSVLVLSMVVAPSHTDFYPGGEKANVMYTSVVYIACFSDLCMATLRRYSEICILDLSWMEACKATSCTRLYACFSALCMGLATLRKVLGNFSLAHSHGRISCYPSKPDKKVGTFGSNAVQHCYPAQRVLFM